MLCIFLFTFTALIILFNNNFYSTNVYFTLQHATCSLSISLPTSILFYFFSKVSKMVEAVDRQISRDKCCTWNSYRDWLLPFCLHNFSSLCAKSTIHLFAFQPSTILFIEFIKLIEKHQNFLTHYLLQTSIRNH